MTALISIDDVELVFAAAGAVPDDQRDAFLRDCLDLLRGRRHVSDVRTAIIEANRLRGRRAAA